MHISATNSANTATTTIRRQAGRRVMLALLAASALTAPSIVLAQTWNGSDSTNYNTAANWSTNAVPTDASSVVVNTETNAPVIGAGQTGRARSISVGVSTAARLTVQQGGTLVVGTSVNPGALTVGAGSGGNGTVRATGAGSTITVNGSLDVAISQNSIGLVEILDGARLSSLARNIGTAADSRGTVTVSGAGSRWDIRTGAGLFLGSLANPTARGTLNVLNGGVVEFAGVNSSLNARGGSDINVSSTNSTLSLLRVLGTTEIRNATMRVATGGVAELGRLTIDGFDGLPDGAVNVDGGVIRSSGISIASNTSASRGRLSITNGGIVRTEEILLTFGGRGQLIVDGAGSLFEITRTNGLIRIEPGQAVGGGADVIIRNGGRFTGSTTTVDFVRDSTLLVSGQGSTFDHRGQLTVGGSATITGAGSLATATRLSVGRDAGVGNVPEEAVPSLVEVLNGGTLRLTQGMALGTTGRSSPGIVRVSGEGSTLDVGAGSNQLRTRGSRVEILNGARLLGTGDWGSFVAGGLRVAGAGTDANFGNNVTLSTGNDALADAGLIVENNGIFRANILATAAANTGPEAGSIIVRSGGQVFAQGLQLGGQRGVLLVDGSSLTVTGAISIGDGTSALGSDFILRNSNVRATSISTTGTGHLIALGALQGEAPGAVGAYDVRDLSLTAGSRFVLNHTGNPLIINSNIAGAGRIQHLAGNTIFTNTSTNFSGETSVTGGTLRVNGNFGIASHTMTVSGGATLGGSGRIGGNVTIADATLAAGDGVGNLTFGNNLVLGADTRLAYELGAPGTPGVGSDLVTVLGNLTLDGTLNITNVGGFGAGLYRLIDYGGTLTNNGLNIGLTPTGFAAENLSIQTSVLRQVNLLVASPIVNFNFWDGANTTSNNVVDGGAGVWTRAGTNWTVANGTPNGAYDPAQLLIFSGTGGAVTVDNSAAPITVGGDLQFAADGYTVNGGPLLLTSPNTTVRVGDGTTAGANFNVTIGSVLTGASALTKTDLGTLTLTGVNTYSGGTRVDAGTLRGNASSLQGAISIASVGTLRFDQTANGTYAGILSGSGILRSTGAGILTLSGNSSRFAGTTIVDNNTLRVTGNLGGRTNIAASGTLIGNGTLGGLDISGRIAPGDGIATLTVAVDAPTVASSPIQLSASPQAQTFTEVSAPSALATQADSGLENTSFSAPALRLGNFIYPTLYRPTEGANSFEVGSETFIGGTLTSPDSPIFDNARSSIFTPSTRGFADSALTNTTPISVTSGMGPSGEGVGSAAHLIFRAGSIFAVDLAASGANDRINVAGTATLEGGVVAITTLDADLAYRDGTVFRILNATGGLTGRFAGLTENSAFLDFTLGYDPTGAFLTLAVIRQFPDVARTINQRAAASALSTLIRPIGSDSLAVYNAILLLSDDAARAAFDASSGEIYASLLATRNRHGLALNNRFAVRGQANLREGLGVWGGLTAHDGRIDADKDLNAGQVSSEGSGGELGLDYRNVSNNWALGVAGGWQDGDMALPVRGSSSQHNAWHIGGYLRSGTGASGFTISAHGVYANADTDVTRNIRFGTIARTAVAQTDVETTALGIEARYGWSNQNWSFGPAVSAGIATSKFSAFTETGAASLNLSGKGSRDTFARYGIGGFTRYTGAKGHFDVTAQYVPGEANSARALLTMAGSPTAFIVFAPRASKTGVRVGAIGQYDLGDKLSISGSVGYMQGSDDRDLSGDIRLSYRF